MAIALATFVLIFGLIGGAYWLLVVAPERRARLALRRRLMGPPSRAGAARSSFLLDHQFSALAGLQSALTRAGRLVEPLQTLIEQSGVRCTAGTFVLGATFAALLAFMLAGAAGVAGSTRLALSIFAVLAPLAYLRRRRYVRRKRYEELFPEALEIMSRSLRAGHAFTTALSIAAEQVPDPVGPELKKLYDSQNYGRPFEDAIRSFAQRAPVLDARFFATAVLTQRETGGNLSEVLDNLTAVIRDRFRVKRQVRALTAQGRLSGWVLAAAPPALALLLFAVNPDHMLSMLHDPTGVKLLTGAVVLQLVGTLMIRRIVNVEY